MPLALNPSRPHALTPSRPHENQVERAERASKAWTLLLSALLCFYVTAEAEDRGLSLNVPEGVDLWAPPQPVSAKAVIFIEVDPERGPVRMALEPTANGQLTVGKEEIDAETLAVLEREYEVVTNESSPQFVAELLNRGQLSSATGNCPLPASLAIAGNANGEAIGGFDIHFSNRPVGKNTQWIAFDFYTKSYRGSRSHMPIALRHEDLLHGWGGFIGDNRFSPQGCGGNSRFNSQIEGWVQVTPDPLEYPNFNPDDPTTYPPPGPHWQSLTYSSSCGAELRDGWIPIAPGAGLPRYRMIMHAASSHWVGYQIQEWDTTSGWSIVTSWTDLDTDLPDPITGDNWHSPPPPYNNGAEGIFIGATDSLSQVPFWSIRLSNIQCGWF